MSGKIVSHHYKYNFLLAAKSLNSRMQSTLRRRTPQQAGGYYYKNKIKNNDKLNSIS